MRHGRHHRVGGRIWWMGILTVYSVCDLALAVIAAPPLDSHPRTIRAAPVQHPADLPAVNYWKQNIFFIPYRFVGDVHATNAPSKVELYVSTDQGGSWTMVQSADPHLKGFTYNAPGDGEYWFTLKTLDQQGRSWPNGPHTAQLRVVVDTISPQLDLTGTQHRDGNLAIDTKALDPHLDETSLAVEVLTQSTDQPVGTEQWQPISLTKSTTSADDFVLAHAIWPIPAGVKPLRLRGEVSDRAGNRQQAATEIQPPSEPTTAVAATPSSSPDAPSLMQRPSANNWQQQADAFAGPWEAVGTGDDWPPSATALAPLGRAPSAPRPPEQRARLTRLPAVDEEDPALELTPADTADFGEATLGTRPPATATSAGSQSAANQDVRLVNSKNFILEYEVDQIGPWGVSKVELWGTRDAGTTWRSYGVDPDNTSPLEVAVDGEGTYGFRILVDSAGAAAARPPQPGSAPEVWVRVDLRPPQAFILGAQPPDARSPDHLILQWQANDDNLQPRPVGLYFSSSPNGPWTPIATGVSNSGHYRWRLERHVPTEIYIRLEVRDTAGNVTTVSTPDPVRLARQRPTGRIRAIRSQQSAAQMFQPPAR